MSMDPNSHAGGHFFVTGGTLRQDARCYVERKADRELRDALTRETGVPLSGLSMGMSGDFEVAIEEGATIVRVGSVIFGGR